MRTETEKDLAFAQGKNIFQIRDEKRGSSRAAAARDAAFAAGANRFTLVNRARDRAVNPETAPPPEKSHDELKAERRARFFGRDAEGNAVGQNRHTTSHVPLDAETEAARKAYHADRGNPAEQPQTPQTVQLDQRTYEAVILQWISTHSDSYYDSNWNFEQLTNCLSDHIQRGEPFTIALLDVVRAELFEGNHLEPKPGPRTRGDFARRSAPTPYERQILTPAEKQELADRQQSAEQSELQAAKHMPLEQLQRNVRRGFRDMRPLDVRGGL